MASMDHPGLAVFHALGINDCIANYNWDIRNEGEPVPLGRDGALVQPRVFSYDRVPKDKDGKDIPGMIERVEMHYTVGIHVSLRSRET